MSASLLLIVVVVSFAGGLTRGLTGFGSALVMTPLLMMAMAPQTVLGVVILVSLATSGQFLRRSFALCEGSVVGPMVLAALPAVPAGIWLLSVAQPDVTRRAVGATVVALAGLLAFRPGLFGAPSGRKSALVGLGSGLLTGFGGIGGPPSVLYVMGLGLEPDRARATFIVYFAAIYPITAAIAALMGIVGWMELGLALAALPAFLAGGEVGGYLYPRVARTRYKEVVLVLLAAAGATAAIG